MFERCESSRFKLIFCAEVQWRNSVAYNRRREFGPTQYPPKNVGAPQDYEQRRPSSSSNCLFVLCQT